MGSLISRRDLFTPPANSSRGEVVHIASLLLHIVPARLDALRTAVSRIPAAELLATAHPAKFAVVLEAGDERALADATERLSAVPGVLTVSIVAHLTEQADLLDEDVQS